MLKRDYKVFVSHASKDARLARRVARQLEETGASVLLDEQSFAPGEAWSPEIRRALRSSDEVLVLVTENSRRSPWVGFEVGAALGLGKRVVPVIEGLGPGEVPSALASLRSVDAKDLSRYLGDVQKRVLGGDLEE